MSHFQPSNEAPQLIPLADHEHNHDMTGKIAWADAVRRNHIYQVRAGFIAVVAEGRLAFPQTFPSLDEAIAALRALAAPTALLSG